MSKNDRKVIGYIASFSRTEVLFVGDACLVMGSEKKLQNHLSKNAPKHKSKANIKKIRFGEILRAINHDEKIVFDEESFNRFYPFGKQIGYYLDAPSSNGNKSNGSDFYLVSSDGLITCKFR